eukprot:gene32740-39148_t
MAGVAAALFGALCPAAAALPPTHAAGRTAFLRAAHERLRGSAVPPHLRAPRRAPVGSNFARFLSPAPP